MDPSKCVHPSLQLSTSHHAQRAGFERIPLEKRIGATARSGRAPKTVDTTEEEISRSFPAPLILPGDDLALDPTSPPQSVRSWASNKADYNPPSTRRCAIYVADAPEISPEVEFMREWIQPDDPAPPAPSRGPKKKKTATGTRPVDEGSASPKIDIPLPKLEDVVHYLRAFYHGLDVDAMWQQPLRFVAWDDEGGQDYVGLQVSRDSCVRVRTRPSPDGKSKRQLNLNDLLDGMMDALPKAAYSTILLVHHDLYEDEDDDFCCGRAYGGSRVCVVSSFRYHPDFDAGEGVDRGHMWPGSHCSYYAYMMRGTLSWKSPLPRDRPLGSVKQEDKGPIHKSAEAVFALPLPSSRDDLHHLWLSRFVRTASHELGHCFAMAHCVYYACVMQSTAGLVEDGRQPPYLCPVCLTKVTNSLHRLKRRYYGEKDTDEHEKYVINRYLALWTLLKNPKWQNVGMFVGFKVWLEERLKEIGEVPKEIVPTEMSSTSKFHIP